MSEGPDWHEVDELFEQALDLPARDRAAFLLERCPDPEMRERVARLLSFAEREGDTLEPDGKLANQLGQLAAGAANAAPGARVLRAGDRIGAYRLVQMLGEGGMGEVWEAEQREPVRRQVALKLIRAGAASRQVIARFHSERQALALMDHPNIARVFDAGSTEDDRPYLAMELVRGIPITEYCDRQRLDTRERLKLLQSVCQAVHHAHMKAIIHRDLKPSNVLVSEIDGVPVPKVIDFGVAKATAQPLTERTMYTEFGQPIGTPEYMSPEQANLDHHDVDVRTDVYSLGVLLYELLTGRLPFDADALRQAGFHEMMRFIREQEPKRPSTRVSLLGADAADAASRRRTQAGDLIRALRGELDWIAMKALEKERARRYESASLLAQDLERYLTGQPVQAGAPGLGYRLSKYLGRHRVPVAAAALVLLAGLLALAGITRGLVRARAAERVAAAEAAKAVAINEFLQETLGAADPFLRLGRDVTVVEALDEAVATLGEAFADQPDIRAALEDTIGWTYQRLARYEDAAPLLRSALERRRRLAGNEPSADVATSALHLARLLRRQGELEEAEPLVHEALAIYRQVSGEPSEDVAATLEDVAWLLTDTGNFDVAEAHFRESRAMSAAVHGARSLEAANAASGLAAVLSNQGDLTQAVGLSREALETRRELLGEDHLIVAGNESQLALMERQLGNLESARALLERALRTRRSKLGDNHPDVADSMNSLGAVHLAERDYVAAEAVFLELVELYREIHGEYHMNVARGLHNLGAVYGSTQEHAKSVASLEQALTINRNVFEAPHPVIALTLSNLARALLQLGGQSVRAERLAREGSVMMAVSMPEDSWRLAVARSIHGEALVALGRHAEAEPLLLEAHEILVRTRGESSGHVTSSRDRLARLYRATGDGEKAAQLEASSDAQ